MLTRGEVAAGIIAQRSARRQSADSLLPFSTAGGVIRFTDSLTEVPPMPDARFDPQSYGPRVADLIGDCRLAPLGHGSIAVAMRTRLQDFNPLQDLGKPIVDRDAARACYSGLWLLHDGLEESHSISQDLGSSEGSCWHAIMHRREPDESNSKYWFRRVGAHSVFDQLREQAPALGYLYTNPFDFVDLCEKVRGLDNAHEELAKKVQLLEWQLLFDHCYQIAVG